ncbi:hypothetical protein DL93DRAFT_2147302 [Clavulina sp. PMI_390]|nr:hypothetical protein DL93DRAFT_2147302 [Clavulina sp. PMI_390]
MASAPLPPLSASVTRILALTGFPPELKTKDIQAAFGEYEPMSGGFKIKWVDDTSLLLVFNDAGVAKRAYLQTILSPPPALAAPNGASRLRIKPYDGPDAQTVIFTVNSRRNTTRGASISVPNSHGRAASMSSGRPAWKGQSNGNGLAASMHAPNGGSSGEGGSPTIPNLPVQPTLNSLIHSSLSDLNVAGSNDQDASESSASPPQNASSSPEPAPPRVGDSARRMVAHGLGLKHPSLSSRRGADPVDTMNKAMGGMVIAE